MISANRFRLADRIVILSKGPRSHVSAIIKVDLPRPRAPGDGDFQGFIGKLKACSIPCRLSDKLGLSQWLVSIESMSRS